jgi:hypothetical protein
MKEAIIEHHVRALNGILASFETSRKLEGQFARERIAVEKMEEARKLLNEELKSREVKSL